MPHDIKLPKLHDVIQIAMGWTDSHLHAFETKSATYQIPFEDNFGMGLGFPAAREQFDESKHRLDDLLAKPKAKCVYTYDFGDNWEHDILLEKLTPADTRLARAGVLAGENACPPEDCGSIPGYCNLVETLANPKHLEHKSLRKWLGLEKGEQFDPAFYDIAAANKELSRLKI